MRVEAETDESKNETRKRIRQRPHKYIELDDEGILDGNGILDGDGIRDGNEIRGRDDCGEGIRGEVSGLA